MIDVELADKEFKKKLKKFTVEQINDMSSQIVEANRQSPDESTKRHERQLRRKTSKADFRVFLFTYFPHYFTTNFGEQQNGLCDDIQLFADKDHRSPKKILRALSRGFGKSTILSLCGVMWLVLRGDWKFVIMVSASLQQAKGFLQKIVDECEDNFALVEDFPELNPAKDQKSQNVAWNDLDIVFSGGARIIAKGFLNAIRGTRYKQYRPDVLIVDDPDEEKDVESESRMARKYRWFDRAALKLGAQWGIERNSQPLVLTRKAKSIPPGLRV